MNDSTTEISKKSDAERLQIRKERLALLRRKENADKIVGIVLFGFPPNAGAVGTAAYLSVFESLFNTLHEMKAQGYDLEPPASVDDLREAILKGNAQTFGQDANVAARVSADTLVTKTPWLDEIEATWGAAPGRVQSNGREVFVLGAQFGNVFVGVQPTFGYEGDPMRLLFEKGLTPTHAFSAFYRYLREDFNAHAVLHFGTHGALEFMPGKQSGMGGNCWPDRLIDDLPNIYFYASNNSSEGAIAKRRSGATLVSYLTPPIAQAGLYKGLNELKASIDRWRQLATDNPERREMVTTLQAQAVALDLVPATPDWFEALGPDALERAVLSLSDSLLTLEYTLIPHGLHVAGRPTSVAQRVDMLLAMGDRKSVV